VPFVLRINIPEYENEKDALHKPHSFLNEAKLSALAISIRLAILTEKRQADCLKFIILDDLLISLDMRNREKVLELLLSKDFIDNYQIIILTHDRMFYQMAKHKIDILEM
jgi:wobble nucleotide-excising tRNase